MAICGELLRATVALNMSCKTNASPPGRKFTLAHELCHLLCDREVGVPLAVASGPWAPADIEKRANAFAAMFLMPADRVRELWNRYIVLNSAPETVRLLSQSFGMGKVATVRHLHNLSIIDADDRDRLEEELASAS